MGYLENITIDFILVIVELFVLLFLVWHIRELGNNSRELEKVVKEMHQSHQELHEDTRVVKDAVDRLEREMNKIPKKRKAAKKK